MKKGDWFKAVIDGKLCIGRVQNEGNGFYLCQDSCDGTSCENKMGFRYSWAIGGGTGQEIKNELVENLTIYNRRPKKGSRGKRI